MKPSAPQKPTTPSASEAPATAGATHGEHEKASPQSAAQTQPQNARYAVNGEFVVSNLHNDHQQPDQADTTEHHLDLTAALKALGDNADVTVKLKLSGSEKLVLSLQNKQGVDITEGSEGIVLKGALASIQSVLSDVDILSVGNGRLNPAIITMDVELAEGGFSKQVHLIFDQGNGLYQPRFKMGNDTPFDAFEPLAQSDNQYDSLLFTQEEFSFRPAALTTGSVLLGGETDSSSPTAAPTPSSVSNGLFDVEGIRALFENLRDKAEDTTPPDSGDGGEPTVTPTAPTTPTEPVRPIEPTAPAAPPPAANVAPTATAIADAFAATTNAFSLDVSGYFSDANGDTLTYSAQLQGGGALPAWLSFDANSGTFSGTAALGDAGDIIVQVTADDGNGETVAASFDLNIAAYDYYFDDTVQNETTTAAAERIFMGGADDTIDAGDGDDTIFGSDGDDVITGGDGDDQMYGGSGADVFNIIGATSGDDTIYDFEQGTDKVALYVASSGIGSAEDQLAFTYDAGNDITVLTHNTLSMTITFKGQYTLTNADFVLNDSAGNLVSSYSGSDDTITGDNDTNMFNGSDGDDVIDGQHGNDTIYGGAGNDRLIGDTLKDLLYGGEGNDTLDGGVAKDTLYGGDGNDKLMGGTRDDELYGEDGDDLLYGEDNRDDLYGGDGNDTLDGGADEDNLTGGAGADIFVYSEDDTIMDFEVGVDKLQLSLATSGIGGSSDQLVVTYTAGSDRTTVTHNDLDIKIVLEGEIILTDADLIEYDSLGTLMSSYTGNDTINGTAGADYLNGDDGDDEVHGAAGNDTIFGGDNEDTLYGDDGDDTIVGMSGNDTLYGGSGADTLKGAGDDDSVYGGDGEDSVYGDNGNDQLFGGADKDVVGGGNGDDTLYGGDGNDYMNGGNGDDVLYGEAGRDTLRGGTGSDTITGGAENDTFLYLNYDESGTTSGIDLIMNFSIAENDRVTLRSMVFDGTVGSEAGQLEVTYDAVNDWTVISDPYSIGEGLEIRMDGNIALTDNEFFLTGDTRGTAGNDTLTGEGVMGFEGDDTLYVTSSGGTSGNGGAGNDFLQNTDNKQTTMSGGADNDTLLGGGSEDILIGGDGDDTFRFDHTNSGDADIILDMNQRGTNDTIALSDASYVFGSAEGGKTGQTLVEGTDITSVAGFGGGSFGVAAGITFLFDTTTRELWYDADDSSGGGNAVLIATINNADYVYDASDFVGF